LRLDAVDDVVTASERDLITLAGIISEDRADLPAGGGLPESLLADLMGQIRCDAVAFVSFDSSRQADWFAQEVPFTDTPGFEDINPSPPGGRAPPPSPSPAHPSAEGPAAPSGRGAHQHPDRPPARDIRGNRALPPGNICQRLHVSSRTAAVTRAFRERAA
jgi:hypothetical protein